MRSWLHNFGCTLPFVLQDGVKVMFVDKEEIQRVVSSCNDFAEAEKRSKERLRLIQCLASYSGSEIIVFIY